MPASDDFQTLSSSLFFWQHYDPAVKVDLSCSAVTTAAGLIFIDPIPLGPDPLSRLIALAPPAAILLTNSNHARAAADYQKKFSIPIHAHAGGRGHLEIEPDEWFQEGPILGGAFHAIPLAGGPEGEVALHHSGGVLSIGDAIINLDAHGFQLLPAKYCNDARQLRLSVEKLLQLSFETMTFAHGLPITTRAKPRLQALLSNTE